MFRLLIAGGLALMLAACGGDMANDGSRPNAAQQTLDRARTTILVASVAASTYAMLTPCSETPRTICKDPAIAAQAAAAISAATTALDVAQSALYVSDDVSALDKVRLASIAVITALKILQSYGIG